MAKKKLKTKTAKKPAKKEENKKKKRVLVIILLTVLVLFSLGIAGHFLYKSCGPKKPEQDYYYVRVIQPESHEWELTVNGKTGRFPVAYGSTLNISVTPTATNDYSALDSSDATYIYYALVQDEETLKKSWKSSQLHLEDGKYVTSFEMQWNYDITIQVNSEEDYENFIYTVDDDGKVIYTYDSSIYNSKVPISKVDVKTLKVIEEPRATFNSNIHIGKKVETLEKSFLTSCPSFDSELVMPNDGKLKFIDDNFLYGCSKFNHPIVFPDSLKEIYGNFMYKCSKFNQPIDTNKIEYLDRYPSTSFLMYGTNFNSAVTFGSSLKAIPAFFLCDCTNFNQPITIPSTITRLRDGFLRNCNSMTSPITVNCARSVIEEVSASSNILVTNNKNAACYVQGFDIISTTDPDMKQYWIECLPEINNDKTKEYRRYKA